MIKISLYILHFFSYALFLDCYAPRNQGRVFVCVKLLGSKHVSDSEYETEELLQSRFNVL